MNNIQGRFRAFRTSIGSVLAAFLLIGCIEAAIMGIRYPMAAGAGWFVDWMARKFHTDLLVGQRTAHWDICAVNLVYALVYLGAFVWVGRRATRRSDVEVKE